MSHSSHVLKVNKTAILITYYYTTENMPKRWRHAVAIPLVSSHLCRCYKRVGRSLRQAFRFQSIDISAFPDVKTDVSNRMVQDHLLLAIVISMNNGNATRSLERTTIPGKVEGSYIYFPIQRSERYIQS